MSKNSKPATKVYLGDSVYAVIDESGRVVLTTENGLPGDPSNRIILEPTVLQALMQYAIGHIAEVGITRSNP